MKFITITGLKYHCKEIPFDTGNKVLLVKEPTNKYDKEAIVVYYSGYGLVGYVANSVYTVYRGTMSAGRIYDKIGKKAFARVMFIGNSSAIAVIIGKH